MNWKSALFIALGPIIGISGAQYYFGNLTVVSFLLLFTFSILAAIFMTFIGNIEKERKCTE